ncbi:MAG: sugar ABC transporter ATP-binding protein [Paraburkholderia sp.]|jgi:ribose transport system ATP-binding protein|uniref:sugar ABC transporter ATP-binding protein n=1 Tax=Paraburkholderia sp. TaxID=1926495 RepID=UPI00397D415E
MLYQAEEASYQKAGPPLIEGVDISMSFGNTHAVSCVSIAGHAGSVHAVTGENGAGKSTFMKILAGVYRPDAGELRMRGKAVTLRNPRSAREHGISTVFQEFTLLPNLTVAENMFIGREPGRPGWINRKQMHERASHTLNALGVNIDPRTLAGSLSVSEQQLVEIAKGITTDASVFIFDEPTAALNGPEVKKLEELIKGLQAKGKSIFYISHRLDEIFRLCDTVTVLKDGKHVLTTPCSELDEHSLVTLMVGRPIEDLFPHKSSGVGPSVLRCERLNSDTGRSEVRLNLNRREIVGLAGLEGQGQREIMRAVAGLEQTLDATIEKFDSVGKPHPVDPNAGVAGRQAHGIAFVPGDRKAEGLYLDLSVAENIVIGTYRDTPLYGRASAQFSLVEDVIARIGLRAKHPKQSVITVSGGNQQKALLARALISGIDIMLVEEPTRGVDVGAKADIYRLLRGFADEGGTVLVSSSELTELIGLCDRILVVRAGTIVAEIDDAQASEEIVMSHALGVLKRKSTEKMQ